MEYILHNSHQKFQKGENFSLRKMSILDSFEIIPQANEELFNQYQLLSEHENFLLYADIHVHRQELLEIINRKFALLLETASKAPTVEVNNNDHMIDITHVLDLPQEKAAEKLGIHRAQLCAAYKIASGGRRWPFRKIRQIRNGMELAQNSPQVLAELQGELQALMRPIRICILR